MTPEAALRLIDGDGQVVEDTYNHEQLQQIIERQEAELCGYRLRVSNLQRKLRDLQGVEPEAGDVKTVLDYWAQRVYEEGWWPARKPTFKPGSDRWTSTRARLKEKWTAPQLCEAVEGALLDASKSKDRLARQGRQFSRSWIDATSIFRSNERTEHFYEQAHDPNMERVKATRELPEELQAKLATGELGWLLQRCDCGHMHLEHCLPLPEEWTIPAMVGWEPCLVRGCECTAFDDIHTQAQEWLRRREARA